MVFNEETKAVQEVAKTTGKGIDLISQIGSAFSGPAKEAIGILQDNIAYRRWINQIKLAEKVQCKIAEIGKSYEVKPIEFKLAVPFLEAATLDEDEYIQDLWANLLINSSYEESGINLKRTYIETLEKLSPFEVKILMLLYSIPYDAVESNGISTYELPERVFVYEDNTGENHKIDEEILLVLTNLFRLGCIEPARTFGGGQRFDRVNPTLYGKYFVKSCTLNFES